MPGFRQEAESTSVDCLFIRTDVQLTLFMIHNMWYVLNHE